MKKTGRSSANYFLLELGVEDLPARFLPGARLYLTEGLRLWLARHQFTGARAQVWVTCRRIALCLSSLPQEKPSERQKFYGPKTASLRDAQGRFLPSVLGFAKSKGINPEELKLEETSKGLCAAAEIVAPSAPLLRLLESEVLPFVFTIPFPKTMRWGQALRFARPIRSAVALWNGKALKRWRLAGLAGSRVSQVFGKSIRIQGAASYQGRMKALGIELNEESRREALDGLLKRCALPGRIWAPHIESLIAEAIDLVERPEVLRGVFNFDYLSLPEEVIGVILSKSKLFAVRRGGKLDARFLAVIERPLRRSALANIRGGYERLVESRLRDARFFWDHDLKLSLSNAEREKKLAGIVWVKELGSLAAKVERVRAAARMSDQSAPMSEDERSHLDLAIRFCKADLTTTLVGEYPELAGRAGAHYAKADPEAACVAGILQDASQELPGTRLAGILVIADCLDTLLAHFALGHKPTPKEDPLGLKRSAERVLYCCWACPALSGVDLDAMLKSDAVALSAQRSDLPDARAELRLYLRGRLSIKLQEEGLGPDRVEAILAANHFASGFCVSKVRAAARALKSLENTQRPQLESLANSFKRAANILRQAGQENINNVNKVNEANKDREEGAPAVSSRLFEHPAERKLFDALNLLNQQITLDVSRQNYDSAFERLSQLAEPLAGFFDSVMVLVDKEPLRNNRLALLGQLKVMVLDLIDPSKLTLK